MKVNVTITLDIDPEAWTLNYGVEGAADIREDVKAYLRSLVLDHFTEIGALA